jgi:hypothetical protein
MSEKFDKDNCCWKVSPKPELNIDMVGRDILIELPFCD